MSDTVLAGDVTFGPAGAVTPELDVPLARREPRLSPGELARVAMSLADVLGAMGVTAADSPVTGPRDWARVLATDTFDAWLIRWPSGGSVEPHDHGGAAGAIAVITGELVELTFPLDATRLRRVLPAGAVHHVDPDAIHDVINEREAPALSLHVYSPPLETMGFYEAGELSRVELVGFEEPVWPSDRLWSE